MENTKAMILKNILAMYRDYLELDRAVYKPLPYVDSESTSVAFRLPRFRSAETVKIARKLTKTITLPMTSGDLRRKKWQLGRAMFSR